MRELMNGLVWVIALAFVFIVVQPNALAKKDKDWVPPGQAKKAAASTAVQPGAAGQTTKSTPPGWSKGKKTGWHGMPYPPGWTKWDNKKQNAWVADRNRALDEIYGISIKYRMPNSKVDEITQAFGQAVAGGLVINDAKDKLVNALKNDETRKSLMINTTQSVLELLK